MRPYNLLSQSLLLTLLLLATGCGKPDSTPPANEAEFIPAPVLDSKAGGITAIPDSGQLQANEEIVISFPTDMVPEESIGKTVVSPVVIEPPLEHSFEWTSPRSGILHLGWEDPSLIPYTLKLQSDLQDLEGKAVNSEGWGIQRAAEDFGLQTVLVFNARNAAYDELSPESIIPPTPKICLEFSRNVLPSQVARRVAFVKAGTKEKTPAVACLDEGQEGKALGSIFLEPAEPLEAGHTYWLVVERLKDAIGTNQTKYLHVLPAGYCTPMETLWAGAYNQPARGAFVRVNFGQRLNAKLLKSDSFVFTPAVSNLKVTADDKQALLTGDFVTGTSYTLQVQAGVMAIGDSKTIKSSEWKLTIPKRRAAIILPSEFIAQRFSQGLDVAFSHTGTSALKWKVATVTPDDITAVRSRLREFANFELDEQMKPMLDPRDQTARFRQTESLIDALNLQVNGEGELPASPGEEETPRRVQWSPPKGQARAGLYLFEVTGTDANGRICGNRCLVSLTDWFVNYMSWSKGRAVRISDMDDGLAKSGVKVMAINEKGEIASEGISGADGIAPLLELKDGSPKYVLAGDQNGWCLQIISGYSRRNFSEDPRNIIQALGHASPEIAGAPWRAAEGIGTQEHYSSDNETTEQESAVYTLSIMTNGDVFKPGESVDIFALVREKTADGLRVPKANAAFNVSVTGYDAENQAYELPLELSDYGGGSVRWNIPEDIVPGSFTVQIYPAEGSVEDDYEKTRSITVTDFRPPEFSLTLDTPRVSGTKAVATVNSKFFHGVPNKGAKVTWTAEWLLEDWPFYEKENVDPDASYEEESGNFDMEASTRMDDWSYHIFQDLFSPEASKQGLEGILAGIRQKAGGAGGQILAVPASQRVRGEGVIDEEGKLIISSECPFQNKGKNGRARVFWTVDVQSPAGQSERIAAEQRIQFAKRMLAIRPWGFDDSEVGFLPFVLRTIKENDDYGDPGLEAELELFLRKTSPAKEKISDNVVIYRNQTEFTSVWKQKVTTPMSMRLPVEQTGDYVLVARPINEPGAVPVSIEFKGYAGETEAAITNDFAFDAVPEKDEQIAGQTAWIQINAPFTGTLRATIESDELMETLPLIELKGTSQKIEIPIRAEYFPNAFVRFHLMSKPAADGVPTERFAECELKVRDPAIQLEVTPKLDSPSFIPRSKVSGHVLVQASGKPLPNAEVTIMVVDEAYLALGSWTLPTLETAFNPDRMHDFRIDGSIGSEWHLPRWREISQFQKGYILGGGGDTEFSGEPPVTVRENAVPRPLWQSRARTDAQGHVPFEFPAPDTLTSYRVAAVAYTATNQYGTGETSVKVSNPVRVEPVTPRFVREGDVLEIRCRLTHDFKSELPLKFTVETEGPITVGSEATQTYTVAADAEQIAIIKATVDENAGEGLASITFKAQSVKGGDAVKITIPVHPRFTQQQEWLSGTIPSGESWNLTKVIPASWKTDKNATVDVLLSGTRLLPQLAGFSPALPSKTAMLPEMAAAAMAPYLVPELASYMPWQPTDTTTPQAEIEEEQAGAMPAWLEVKALQQARQFMDTLENSLLPDKDIGWLPQFPSGKDYDAHTTAFVAWAALEASMLNSEEALNGEEGGTTAGFDKIGPQWSSRLQSDLGGWRIKLINNQLDQSSDPNIRAITLAAESLSIKNLELYPYSNVDLKVTARALYDHRETLDLEGRCFLGLAVYNLETRRQAVATEETEAVSILNEDEKKTLLSEIQASQIPSGFNEQTQCTPARAEAMRLYALSTLRRAWTPDVVPDFEPGLRLLGKASAQASSQENTWRLLAAKGLLLQEDPAILSEFDFAPEGFEASANGVTLGWLRHPVASLATSFASPVTPGVDASWMLKATWRSQVKEPVSRPGLSMSRQVYNLTAKERTGEENAAFQTGDYVLITYQISSDEPRAYFMIEEHLPASLESLNPDLPSVKRSFTLPTQANRNEAVLDYAHHEADRVTLYFKSLPKGETYYGILTQVTAAGQYSWPSAQAMPAYDRHLFTATPDVPVFAKR